MTDRERCDDESLKKCIQEAYGCTDEQLMDELNEIEESLSDSDFPDVEDRIMSRLMKRIEETAPEEIEEDKEEIKENFLQENSEGTDRKERKVVRFGRKKLLLAAVLAATFAGTLGVTAIGGKSYFFRVDEKKTGIIFDSGKNKSDIDSLGDAYEEIENKFGEKIFALNYLPADIEFVSLSFESYKATIKLKYQESYIYFVQWKSDEETSINTEIDLSNADYVENGWLNEKIYYHENDTEKMEKEYKAQIKKSNNCCWIFGKVDKDEFKKILENIYFYN